MNLVARVVVGWLLNAAAIWVAVKIFGGVSASDWWAILIAAAVFGVVNAIVKPILVLLTLPFIVITLGIVLFLINMAMLALTAWIVSGFSIDGFWTLVGATIVVWLVNVALEGLFRRAAAEY